MLEGDYRNLKSCAPPHREQGGCDLGVCVANAAHQLCALCAAGRLGVSVRSIVGVPCHEHATLSTNLPPPVTGVLVLYSCPVLEQVTPSLEMHTMLSSVASS